MPYYLYNKQTNEQDISYTYKGREVSIAGCNNGIIASELRKIIRPEYIPPLGWKLPIAKNYNAQNSALIVDLNPKGTESSLAEIDTVFGFSYKDWTPIMLRLKLVTYWYDKSKINEDSISFPIGEK
jgi:hypothetical protein